MELECAVSEPGNLHTKIILRLTWLDGAIPQQSSLSFFPGIDNGRNLLEQRRARRIRTPANELEAGIGP